MSVIHFGQFVFEPATGDLINDDCVVRLRPKTARLLGYFLDHAQTPLTRDEIFNAVWPDRIVTDNTLMQSVRELRGALRDAAAEPQFIETMHRRGYRWIGPARTDSEAPDRAGSVTTSLRHLLVRRWKFATVVAVLFFGLTNWSLLPVPPGDTLNQDMQRAQSARASGESELAQRYYEAALIRDADDIEARVGLATMLYEIGDWDRAMTIVSEPVSSPYAELFTSERAELDLIAGQIALGRGELTLAESRFTSVRNHSGQNFVPVIHAVALNGLSQVYVDQGRITEYMAIRAEMVDPLLMSAQIETFAEGLLSAGSMVRPSFDESWGLPRLQRALVVFEEIGDIGGIARAHTALGSNFALDDATREQHLREAVRLYRTAGHLPGELNVLVHLASFEIGRFHAGTALEYIERGLELSVALNAPRLHADFVYRYGLALMSSVEHLPFDEQAGRIEEALAAYERASAEYSSLGIVLDGLAPQLHAAIARLDVGDAAGAIYEFEALILAYRDLPFPPGELGASLGRAASLAKLGRREDAEQILAEIEQRLPQVAPVTNAVQSSFLDTQSNPSSSSMFAIIITAEQQLAGVNGRSN